MEKEEIKQILSHVLSLDEQMKALAREKAKEVEILSEQESTRIPEYRDLQTKRLDDQIRQRVLETQHLTEETLEYMKQSSEEKLKSLGDVYQTRKHSLVQEIVKDLKEAKL